MNVVGLQTDDAGHVDRNISAHVAHVVGLQTDAVVVTETRFKEENGPSTALISMRSYEQKINFIESGHTCLQLSKSRI